jgi:hypothetical protein
MIEENGTEKVKKSIFSEVKLIYVVVVICLGIAFYVWNGQTQQDIQIIKLEDTLHNVQETINTIKSNDLAHIEVKMDTLTNEIRSLHDTVLTMQATLKSK